MITKLTPFKPLKKNMSCGNCNSANKNSPLGLCSECLYCMTERELFGYFSTDNSKFRALNAKAGKCRICHPDSENQKVVNQLCILHYGLCKDHNCLKRATSSDYCNIHQPDNDAISSSSGSDPTFESVDSPVSGGGSVVKSVPVSDTISKLKCSCIKDKCKTEGCTSLVVHKPRQLTGKMRRMKPNGSCCTPYVYCQEHLDKHLLQNPDK